MRGALICLLALSVWVAYLPLLNAGWIYDDVNLVRPSPALTNIAGLLRAVSTDLYSQAGARLEVSAYWRPLAMASYWLDTRIGEAPGALHMGNIIWQALATAMLALVIMRRHPGAGGLAAAMLASAWWAFHPQNAEVIAWISCRYEILTAISLLGLILLPRQPGLLHSAWFGLVFLAGLLAKESFVAALAVVMAMDLADRSPLRAVVMRWLAVGLAFLIWLGLRGLLGLKSMDLPPPAATAAIALNYLETIALYLWRAFTFPPLTVSHPFANSFWRVICGGVILLALVAAALFWRQPVKENTLSEQAAPKGRRWLAVPVAIFLAGLLPMAGAITLFGEAPERYFYLPSIGLALMVGELLAYAGTLRFKFVRVCTPLVFVLLTAVGLILVERRLPAWQSEDALWASALKVDPQDAQANYSIAIAAGREGDWQEARRALAVAARAKPNSARIANAYAWVLVETRDFPSAIREAQRATSLAPYDPNGWYYLAFARHKIGDHAGELTAVRKLLEVAPNYPGATQMRTVATCEVSGGKNCLRAK